MENETFSQEKMVSQIGKISMITIIGVRKLCFRKNAKAQLLHSVRGVPPYAKVKLSDAGIRQFC